MNLYGEKSKNIRKTWFLMTLFFGMVIGIGWFFSQVYANSAILYFAVIFSILMNIAGYWYSDKIVLRMHHARPVELKSRPELYRILENLTIAAGMPMPKFYVIDDSSPNAFAVGRSPEHAAVAVTSGLLDILDRSELEGVLAHELSHIGNRDILISTIAVVLVGFVAILSDMFMRSLWFRGTFGGGRDRGSANGIIIIAGIALSILAPVIASLIHLAISRKRELLADASGVLLTRYPEGLISALRKLENNPRRLRLAANSTAHLFFQNPFGADRIKRERGGRAERVSFLAKMFSTHPPIAERIAALAGEQK